MTVGSNRKNKSRAAVEISPDSHKSDRGKFGPDSKQPNRLTPPMTNSLHNQPLPEPPPTRRQLWLLIASAVALVAWLAALAILSLASKH